MHEIESTIIPLDDAHEILGVFGISPNSRKYQRARREDGLRQIDLECLLDESGLVLVVDWRAWLQEIVETIAQQATRFDMVLGVGLDDEGNQGSLHIGERDAHVKYIPTDDDDFNEVISAVNQLIGSKAHYKKFRSCEGSDGWVYALLSNQDWQALNTAIPKTFTLIFKDAIAT